MKDLLILAEGEVGLKCTQFLIEICRNDIGLIVTTSDNEISTLARGATIATCVAQDDGTIVEEAHKRGLVPEMGLLLWWPHIVKAPLLDFPKAGFINTHPSYLPFNRGKHYSFWALVEQAPFGVTLHKVDSGIDTGEIIAQQEIAYDWLDTGQTLAQKAKIAMIELFCETYPKLTKGAIQSQPQADGLGSFHRAREIELASKIDLDAPTTARDLLNLLRAKMFDGLPACSFQDGGETYEVKIDIRKIL
jgi:methionyl-tRNA formyltransferase